MILTRLFHIYTRALCGVCTVAAGLLVAAPCCAAEPRGAINAQFEELGRAAIPYGSPQAARIVGSRVYLANGAGGLVTVDISQPTTPRLLGRFLTGNTSHESIGREWIEEYKGYATAVDVAGTYAYVLTQSSGYDLGRTKVLQFDVSDPSAPVLRSEYLLFDSASGIVALDANTVCVARSVGGEPFPPNREGVLSVLDFTTAGRARIVASLPAPSEVKSSFQHLTVAGTTLFICGAERGAGTGRLFVVDLADRARPALIASLPTKGPASGLAVAPGGKIVYVADGAGGVSVVDVADRMHPQIAGGLQIANARAVAIDNDRLRVLADEGLLSFDTKIPPAPRAVGVEKVDSRALSIAAGANALAVPDAKAGLLVFRAADSGTKYAGKYAAAGEALQLALHGKQVLVAAGEGGAMTFDCANPSGPLLTEVHFLPGAVSDVGALDKRIIMAESSLGLVTPRLELDSSSPVIPKAGNKEKRLFVEGTTVYAAVRDTGLRIYDASAAIPVMLGELKWPEDERLNPSAVYVLGKIAYLATGRDGLRTIDVADPRHPAWLGRFYDDAINRMTTVDVKVVGTTAYLADLDNGLYVVDVADPRQPRELAHYHTGNAHTIDVLGNLAVTADGMYGAQLFDVADPPHPRRLGSFHAPGIKFNSALLTTAFGGTVESPHLVVADAGWLRIFRLHPEAPANLKYGSPRLVSHLKLPMGIPDALRVSDDGMFAYAASDEGWNLAIYDLGKLTEPRFRNAAATSGFAHGIALQGRTAFVCNNYNACTIFDVSNPDKPLLLSAVMGLKRARTVQVRGSALFIATEDGTVCVDISDLKKPLSKGVYKGLGIDFGILERTGKRYLLGSGEGGWQVVDVTDLAAPQRVGLLAGQFGSTTTAGDAICVGQSKELLTVVLEGNEPRIMGRLNVGEDVGRLDARGHYVYSGGPLLNVVDIADPAKPALLGSLKGEFNEGTYGGATPYFSDVRPFKRGDRDYVAAVDMYWGMRLYDATDKKNLKEIGDFAYSGGDFTGTQVSGGRAYVGNNWGGVYIADVSDALHPRLLSGTRRLTKPNKGSVGHLVAGNTLYLQGNTDRVMRTVDVTDPAKPKLLGEFALPKEGQEGDTRRFGSTFPQLRGRYLYTPGFARIYDVSDPAKPILVGEAKDAGFMNDTCALADIAGGSYLILGSQEGLKVVDVKDPTRPQLVGMVPGDFQGGYYFNRALQVEGNIAYVTDRHQLDIVDLSNPRQPRRLSSVEIGGTTNDVRVVDGIAYVIAYFNGLHMIDVRDPANPKPIDHFQDGVYWDAAAWDNLACYQTIDIANGYAYVGEYYSGLLVIKLGGD